ncbi:MAG: trimethylamine methyltransferase family protein [Candidatus Atribacteria bacterium]|nr:trimethylamine methyltransferase family protein [Candidatus Atribacteria bacterium]
MKLSRLEVLSPEEINLIHQRSLDILAEVGILVESEAARELVLSHGGKLKDKRGVVTVPPKLVERCVKLLPREVPLFDREGNLAFTLGDGGMYCVSGHNAVFMLDTERGERRDSTVQDVERFAVISQEMSDIDMVGVPLMPQDVTPQTTLLHAIAAIFRNATRPVFFSSESEAINRAVIEMGKAVMGKATLQGSSCLVSQLSTTSPLYWERGAVEALLLVAREGVPLDFLPQPIAGLTAPYTLAGLLAVHNAEVLSGVVLAQLVNPGTPVIYGAAWTTYEMKRANVLIGRAESSLLRIAGAQMAHFYGMPSHTTAPDTDAHLPDQQTAWEKMLSTVAGLIGGNDMVVNLGMFGTGMIVSLEQLVLDNEMYRIVKRFARGIEVDENHIAFEVIRSVGPRGEFLTSEHTLRFLRTGEHQELWVSSGANYEGWVNEGRKSVYEKAADIVVKILQRGPRFPLSEEKARCLQEIIIESERRMGVH